MSTAALTRTRAPKIKSDELVMDDGRIIRVESYKRGEWDRGAKKVYVDGVQWGWIETKWHGSHGTSFHLSDMHGVVRRPYDPPSPRGEQTDVSARCDSATYIRRQNIGLPESEQVKARSAEKVMLDMCTKAIVAGWFRAPDVRNKEIAAARERSEASRRRIEQASEQAFSDKADSILDGGVVTATCQLHGLHFSDPQALKAAILDAMKWAQTQ